MLEKETNGEEVVIAVEEKEMTPRKESSLTEEVVAEEVTVTTITATPEDPAPQKETLETMATLEETMNAAEMTMVAIPAR